MDSRGVVPSVDHIITFPRRTASGPLIKKMGENLQRDDKRCRPPALWRLLSRRAQGAPNSLVGECLSAPLPHVFTGGFCQGLEGRRPRRDPAGTPGGRCGALATE